MHSMTQTLSQDNTIIVYNKFQPWIVCFSAALFFFYEFIQMHMFNAVSRDLMRDFSIDATQLGNLSAIYFYSNVLFLLFSGVILDRFSTRRVILITLSLCAIGIGTFALTHSLIIAGISRFISGIGSAFCFLSSIRLASRWFPAQRMALVSGLIVTMAMTGGMVAQTPLTFFVELLGWRHALLLDSALGFIFAGIIWTFVRDYPRNIQPQEIAQQRAGISIFQSWCQAYSKKQNWLCAIYTCLMNLPIALLGAVWGELFLVQIHGLSQLTASYITMVLFLGSIIGSPVMGWFSDFIQRRRMPMVLGMLFALIITLLIVYLPTFSFTTYLILFFLLGFFTSSQIISYPLVSESNPKAFTATSVSVVSLTTMSGYAIFQPLFGWLMDRNWHGIMIDNVRIYSANNFHSALLIIPISFVIALLAALLVRETYCQRKD
jgi:MFS family permease